MKKAQFEMSDSLKRFLYALFTTLVLFTLRYNNVIVAESPIVNELLYILFWVAILFLFIESLSLKNLFARILLSILFGIVALIGFVFVFFSAFEIINLATSDKNLSFECIHQINYQNENIKVYRTNGGATTDFGIVVRSERKILPGILLVNEFIHSYPMDTVSLEVANNSILKILNTRENNSLLKQVNLSENNYSFFTAWSNFFTGEIRKQNLR
jgi:hypothetical protein